MLLSKNNNLRYYKLANALSDPLSLFKPQTVSQLKYLKSIKHPNAMLITYTMYNSRTLFKSAYALRRCRRFLQDDISGLFNTSLMKGSLIFPNAASYIIEIDYLANWKLLPRKKYIRKLQFESNAFFTSRRSHPKRQKS